MLYLYFNVVSILYCCIYTLVLYLYFIVVYILFIAEIRSIPFQPFAGNYLSSVSYNCVISIHFGIRFKLVVKLQTKGRV